MARPRGISDDEILMATARVMARVPPRALTLALVGREVDLAPATLLQRFGSKLGLLHALAQAGARGMPDALTAVRARFASPTQALEAYLQGFAMLAPSADVLANNLAYLQLDLTEPTLRAPTRAMFVAHEEALRMLLSDAVADGELNALDVSAVARTLLTVTQGALIMWAVHRTGTVRAAIEREVGTVLLPYRVINAFRDRVGESRRRRPPQAGEMRGSRPRGVNGGATPCDGKNRYEASQPLSANASLRPQASPSDVFSGTESPPPI